MADKQTLVGVECHIGFKQCFEEIEECGFSSISFLRHKQKYREFLQWLCVEQLQVVKPQFILTAEDMAYKSLNGRPLSRLGSVADGSIAVEECADDGIISDVGGNTAEPVIFRYVGKKVLAVVLSDSLDAPRQPPF